jgi:hypothetical protein
MATDGWVADFSPRSVRISVGTFADDLVDEIRHDRLAVHLLQMGERNLARTETVDADLVLGVGEPHVQLRFHIPLGDNDLDFALQPFSERFGNLHFHTFISWRRCSDSRWFQ